MGDSQGTVGDKPSVVERTQGRFRKQERKRKGGGRLTSDRPRIPLHSLSLVKKRTSDGRKDLNEKNLRKHHPRSIQNDPQGEEPEKRQNAGGGRHRKNLRRKSPPKAWNKEKGKRKETLND
ncbi:hypothetical protein TNIN_27861 [Trichonephila inaurata madagascariensis]|uniref:Uncharacterized protein n=1 Tax=Trichonephila inaurata madagascariensis TaxID=2747483 RepID=A0A8X6YHN6_9ARAC|nr:hypothetical protein TNIN_27861 [Trichonephila inaurata madagascariensis]